MYCLRVRYRRRGATHSLCGGFTLFRLFTQLTYAKFSIYLPWICGTRRRATVDLVLFDRRAVWAEHPDFHVFQAPEDLFRNRKRKSIDQVLLLNNREKELRAHRRRACVSQYEYEEDLFYTWKGGSRGTMKWGKTGEELAGSNGRKNQQGRRSISNMYRESSRFPPPIFALLYNNILNKFFKQ